MYRISRLYLVKEKLVLGDQNPQIDEALWQAWLQKNKARDRFRYERRIALLTLVAVLVLAGVLLWKWVE